MIKFTGMKYFLDKVGVETSSVSAAFTFYENSGSDQKITNPNFNHPGFGYSISTNDMGNLLLVGSLTEKSAQLSGQVYAYVKDYYQNWNLKQVFNNGNISGQFGQSIANSDDGSIIMIGASRVNNNSGCVYIYTGEQNYGWNLKQILSGQTGNSFFGWDIATNSGSSVIAVGAPRDAENGALAGTVFLYTGNKSDGWILNQKLSGSEVLGAGTRINDYLGTNISMSKNSEIISVSSVGSTVSFSNAGMVYIYTGNGSQWNIKQIISGSGDTALNRRFGHGLSNNNDGSIIVVSQRNSNNNPSGAFWLYTGSKSGFYNPVQKLAGVINYGYTDAVDSKLPVSMNFDGSVFVAGLPFQNSSTDVSLQTGIALIFTGRNNSWQLKTKFSGDNLSADRFGFSTAISKDGSEIFIGAPNDSISLLNSGSIWLYNIDKDIVRPDTWAYNSSYGILNKNNNFFTYSGTGFFNGSSIMKLNESYTFDNDTILLSYEKLRTGDEILLSSVTGNSFSTYSGFCVGVNNANKLYFKYWNSVEGVFSFTYSKNLANKNLVLLNRNNDILTIGNLNNNTEMLETETFYIKNNFLTQGKDLFIGGMYNNVPWANAQASNFSGYIDKLFIFKDFNSNYNQYCVSGIISLATGAQGYYENNCYITGYFINSGLTGGSGITGYSTTFYSTNFTGITGYTTGLSGYSYSGITGYNKISLGFYSNNCNNTIEIFNEIPLSGLITTNYIINSGLTGIINFTGYNQIPLSGLITGYQKIYVTGLNCDSYFIETGDPQFIKNIDYLKSLSLSEISLLKTVNSINDIVELYHENYQNKTLNYNNNLIYDGSNNTFFTKDFIDETLIPTGVLLYLNGQLILDSGFTIDDTGYNEYIIPNIDYYTDGNRAYVNSFINEDDNLFYDNLTGNSEIIYITGINSGDKIINQDFTNKLIFLNGQKLISGITYTGINTINISLPSGTGYLFIKSTPSSLNYYSGNSSTLRLNKENLNTNCSQVYINGIKQKINEDYFENSNFDLLSGNFNENQNNFIIYNNTNDFFV